MSSQPHPDAIRDLLAGARDTYDGSVDCTLGIEEEFAIVDPDTLDLVPAFDRVESAAQAAGLTANVVGELIAAEVEFRSGPHQTYADAVSSHSALRASVAELVEMLGLAVAASGTHPWADYREQEIIEADYYQQLVRRMRWVTQRNNTFGLHVHVGVRGADRAIAVADALREIQPVLLALSVSSPFLDGIDTGMSSMRHMIFSRMFPRGNVAPRFGDWAGYERVVNALTDAGSLTTYGQMWWGVRAHAMHGTVECRMFDGQPDLQRTLALAALASGTVADLCDRIDARESAGLVVDAPQPQPAWVVDENMWRAARHGMDAEMLLSERGDVAPVSDLAEQLVARAREASTRRSLGLESGLETILSIGAEGSTSAAQRRIYAETDSLAAAYRSVVQQTMGTNAAAGVRSGR